jgi:hypothetical protein
MVKTLQFKFYVIFLTLIVLGSLFDVVFGASHFPTKDVDKTPKDKLMAGKPTLISANAGRDQTVDEIKTVQLDGTCYDKLGRDISYTWTQTLGPSVSLSSTENNDPIFVTPKIPNGPIVPLAFRLICNVAEGGGTAADVVIIRVRPVNDFPIAKAGPDKETMSRRIVYLSSIDSLDPDGDRLQYVWRQIKGNDVEITYLDRKSVRFVAPEVSDISTQLEFELTVSDPYDGKDSDKVVVTVKSERYLYNRQ